MNFFDSNYIYGPVRCFKKGMPTTIDLARTKMRRLGVNRVLAVHSLAKETDPVDGNRLLMEEIKDAPDIHPCLVIGPSAREIETVRELIDVYHAKAVKLYPTEQNFILKPWVVSKMLDAVASMGLVLFIELCQSEFPFTIDVDLDDICQLCNTYPDIPVVLCRANFRSTKNLYPLIEACDNVVLETSALWNFRVVEYITNTYGAHRLVFGSYSPFQEVAASVGMIYYSNISAEDKGNIASGNLARLLGFEL